MDEGVELKQLTVGVDSVGLGVGAGLAGAIAVMAINAASVVIVFIILLFICFFVVVWLCDCWMAAVAIQEKFFLDVGLYFSPASPRTAARSSWEKSNCLFNS